MKTLTSTKDMSREDWLEARKMGLGGSDSPKIVLSENYPFKPRNGNSVIRELWEEKVGIAEEIEETNAMKRGKYLEPVAATLYTEETGRKTRKINRILQHSEFPFVLANVDREICRAGNDGAGILEIKCPGLRTFAKCKKDGLPDYYQIQLQHYLAVTGKKWGAFAVFNAELWEMIHFDIQRDEEMINLILTEDRNFWKKVEDGVPPEETSRTSIILPPIEANTDVVKLEDHPGWIQAVSDLREAKDILDQAHELEDSAKNRMQNIMEMFGAHVAEGAGARVHWTEQAGRTSFDHKKLQKDHPEIDYTPYIKNGNPFRVFKPYFLQEAINE